MFLFTDGNKFDFTSPTSKMCFDGVNFWVALADKTVQVCSFMGYEPYNVAEVDLTSYFSGAPIDIVHADEKVFVFESSQSSSDYTGDFIKAFVIINKYTLEVERYVELPQMAHCVPCYGKLKLWFVTPADTTIDGEAQKIYSFDIRANTWSSLYSLPGPRQLSPRKIIWGRENWVWVDSYNGNGVIKVDASTSQPGSLILTNRKPSSLYCNDDKQVLVVGANGMITTIDQTTDTATNSYGLTVEASSLVDNGTYVWAVGPTLVRLEKAAAVDNIRIMNSEQKDYSIEPFSSTSFTQVIATPTYSHETWNEELETIDTIVEPERVAVLGTNSLWVAYNFTDSWDLYDTRDYYLRIRGTAMISTGPDNYYGETQ